MSGNETWGLISLSIFCIFLSAFFSSAEAAYLSLQKSRISHLASTGHLSAIKVSKMIQTPENLLFTILLANNLVNVAFAAIVTAIIVDKIGEAFGVIIATLLGTICLLVFGETIPKSLALRHSEKIAFIYANPLILTQWAFKPIVTILHWLSKHIGSFFGSVSNISITEGELRTLIDIGEAEGTFESSEAEMLENVFRFGDRQVREVMTPRTEIISIKRGTTLNKFLSVYKSYPHTRFPIFKESVDNIIGIISTKDILKAMANKSINLEESVTDSIRDVFFVPETKRIAELFNELRQTGNQIAIAIDEFGGIAGLVSLKELVEEVMGPVGEEGHGPEEEVETIDKNTFQVDGGISLEEANEQMKISLPEGDYETVAGFVLNILGKIPNEGQQLSYKNLKIEIITMKNLKIETLQISKSKIYKYEKLN
ncbi:MAG: hemolysin [Chloroflexi bacterium]|nr:hemolysin [Chloroflexota bacterium]|tara:strand:- start:62338 stop:63618 length:1281 start_codon:yes stop_codon:yes gene_type:complete